MQFFTHICGLENRLPIQKKKTIGSWPLKNFIATPLYMCLYVYSMSKLCIIDFTSYNNYYLYKYWITTEYCSVIGLFMVMCFYIYTSREYYSGTPLFVT